MSGLGGYEAAGKIVTVRTDLPGDVDGILDAIRKILLMGDVQSVVLKNDEPITYQRFIRHGEELKPSESTQSFAELSPFDIVRNAEMEEWDPGDRTPSPQEQLLWMFVDMAVQGWSVTHILLSDPARFWQWLEMPSGRPARRIDHYLGARIELDEQIPGDIFLLCCSRTRHATIAEIGFALKGNMIDERRTDPQSN